MICGRMLRLDMTARDKVHTTIHTIACDRIRLDSHLDRIQQGTETALLGTEDRKEAQAERLVQADMLTKPGMGGDRLPAGHSDPPTHSVPNPTDPNTAMAKVANNLIHAQGQGGMETTQAVNLPLGRIEESQQILRIWKLKNREPVQDAHPLNGQV